MDNNKGKIYRFGNLVLEYFPAVKNESVACYQVRTIQNDARVEWDEGTVTFNWIEYLIKEKGSDKLHYDYLGNMLLMLYNLSCAWIPTMEGLNNIAKEYMEDVKRWKQNKEITPEEDQKIIEEERKQHDSLH